MVVLGLSSPIHATTYGWQPDFAGPGVDGSVAAAVVHQGQPYIAGNFTTAGASGKPYLARWDGLRWQPVLDAQGLGLEPPEPPQSMRITAMASFNGELIVAGNFTHAGGRLVNNIVRFDGQSWLPLGPSHAPGADNYVNSLTVWNGSLLAGGWFSQIGGIAVKGLASWSGTQWQPFSAGGGVDSDGRVSVIRILGGSLYVGGKFSSIGGAPIHGLARWNGTQWQGFSSEQGNLQYADIIDVEIYNGDLIAGGSIGNIGDVNVQNIARWDGQHWNAMAGSGDFPDPWNNGMDNLVHAMEVWNGKLYVGGAFDYVGGLRSSGMTIWNGQTWLTPETSDTLNLSMLTNGFLIHSNQLVAFGNGGWLDGGNAISPGLSRLGATGWQPFSSIPGTGLSSSTNNEPSVRSMVSFNGDLVVGGRFLHAGNNRATNIARWNGQYWSPLFGPVEEGFNQTSSIRDMLVHEGSLYVGGSGLYEAGGIDVSGIARWDGQRWHTIGSTSSGNLNGSIYSLAIYQGELHAAGRIGLVNGVLFNGIARWDGSQWQPLTGSMGTGVEGESNSYINALHVHDGVLYAGGLFSQAGGRPATALARWNGVDWSAVPGWTPSSSTSSSVQVTALGTWQEGLVVGGGFSKIGDANASGVAFWNGLAWSALAGEHGQGVSHYVYQFEEYQGDLLLAGPWNADGILAVNGVARWNGERWRGLPGPSSAGMQDGYNLAYVGALAVHDQQLFAGGLFRTAGGVPAWNMARFEFNPIEIDIESVEPTTPDPGDIAAVSAIITSPTDLIGPGIGRIESTEGTGCTTTTFEAIGAGRWRFACQFVVSESGRYEISARYESDDASVQASSTPFLQIVRWPAGLKFQQVSPPEIQVTGQPFFVVVGFDSPLWRDPSGDVTITTSQGHSCQGNGDEVMCLFRSDTAGGMVINAEFAGDYYHSADQAARTYVIQQAVLEFNPSTLDFGTVSIPGTPPEESLEIANVSGQSAQIDSVDLLSYIPYFEITDSGSCGEFPVIIAPQSSCTVGIRFMPKLAGGYGTRAYLTAPTLNGTYEVRIIGRASTTIHSDRFEAAD